MGMKLTCDEATKICDKNQYGEISFLERIKLQFHLITCKLCGKYSKQNVIMTKCLEKHKNVEKKATPCLAKEEKICMKEEIDAKL
jgi:hypothetical protein